MKHLQLTIKLFLLVLILSLLSGSTIQNKNVVICTGKSAVVYHSHKNCKGLNRCGSSLKTVTLEEAKKLGRRPCKICY
jgi:serine/threonine-protein kinase RIO1